MARKRPESELVKALQPYTATPHGYKQCEWRADGVQCRYPGTISTNTKEGGPWYCGLHFQCDSAAYGASVVEASKDYQHPTAEQIEAEHMREVRASLDAQGLARLPGESALAWRKRTSEWMRGKATAKRFDEAA